jgi:hypothetical protein
MTGEEIGSIETMQELTRDFLKKLELVDALRTFRAAPGQDVEDAVLTECRADADTLCEFLCSWLGWRVAGRKVA